MRRQQRHAAASIPALPQLVAAARRHASTGLPIGTICLPCMLHGSDITMHGNGGHSHTSPSSCFHALPAMLASSARALLGFLGGSVNAGVPRQLLMQLPLQLDPSSSPACVSEPWQPAGAPKANSRSRANNVAQSLHKTMVSIGISPENVPCMLLLIRLVLRLSCLTFGDCALQSGTHASTQSVTTTPQHLPGVGCVDSVC